MLHRPGYYEKLGSVILKKFLLLAVILDRAKSQSNLPISYGIDGLDGGLPLSFTSRASIKSSSEMISGFLSSNVMHGVGADVFVLVRRLGYDDILYATRYYMSSYPQKPYYMGMMTSCSIQPQKPYNMSSYPSCLTKTKTSAHAPQVSKRNNRSTHPNSSKSLGIAKDENIYDRVHNLEASLGQALEDLEH
ncbi:hypothetical protein Tco_0413652 [Tanacetum coccineum]